MTPEKTILIFIDWFEPGFRAGGPVRSVINLIDSLQGKWHFRVVCSDTDYRESQPYPGIETEKWIRQPNGSEVMYLSARHRKFRTIRHLVRSHPEAVIYTQGIFSPVFSVFPVVAAKNAGKKPVVAVRGMLHSTALGIKSRKKSLFLTFCRLTGMFRNCILQASDEAEKLEIEKNLGAGYDIVAAPNIPSRPAETVPEKIKHPGELNCISIARISPEKNQEYLLKMLSAETGNISVDLYGPLGDTEYAAQVQGMAAELPANVKVHFRGEIEPKDARNALQQAHLFVLPTRGENFGHAIYEALSAGVPVLISDNTPFRGLKEKQCGFDISLNNIEDFQHALHLFLDMDTAALSAWKQNAHALARTVYRDQAHSAPYEVLFGKGT